MRGGLPDVPVLYEDNHVLVVEKPVNVPSQGDISKDASLLDILKDDLKRRYDKPGNVFLSLVHRLDRPVGGVMVLAKTSKGASRLSSQIREGSFRKLYFCVVHGEPKLVKGTLRDELAKDRERNVVRVVGEKERGSKEAVLRYETLRVSGGLSLLRVELETGRSHQIRVQLANAGCPLYGDQKYGIGVTKAGKQLALWSCVIEFEHPTKKERMRFTSRPPERAPWSYFGPKTLDFGEE